MKVRVLPKPLQVNLQKRDLYEGEGVYGRKILERSLKKQASTGIIWLRLGITRGFLVNTALNLQF
jgi:hypothetical protein